MLFIILAVIDFAFNHSSFSATDVILLLAVAVTSLVSFGTFWSLSLKTATERRWLSVLCIVAAVGSLAFGYLFLAVIFIVIMAYVVLWGVVKIIMALIRFGMGIGDYIICD